MDAATVSAHGGCHGCAAQLQQARQAALERQRISAVNIVRKGVLVATTSAACNTRPCGPIRELTGVRRPQVWTVSFTPKEELCFPPPDAWHTLGTTEQCPRNPSWREPRLCRPPRAAFSLGPGFRTLNPSSSFEGRPLAQWLKAAALALLLSYGPLTPPQALATESSEVQSLAPPPGGGSGPERAAAAPGAAEGLPAIVDSAGVLSEAREQDLRAELAGLEEDTGWRVRVLTRDGRGGGPSSAALRAAWLPDDRTIIIVEDVGSPNVLNFNTGDAVRQKLPRQFFVELQSRYGNQFFVAEEGTAEAVVQAARAVDGCLRRPGGCRYVPGLVDDLYFLTLATSAAGGAVFGFSARSPPSGRVTASWQWVLVFSPLWGILFVAFGILPVAGRTADWAPLAKNAAAFLAGAAAIYLTPILGGP